jgi:hypothetical protein
MPHLRDGFIVAKVGIAAQRRPLFWVPHSSRFCDEWDIVAQRRPAFRPSR